LGQCNNYRTIALVSHASKILLKIILERIRRKTEEEIAEEQAGFRKGRGTRDQILNLRNIMQKSKEHQQHLFMCFIDFQKAFDSINHETLWIAMIELGFPSHIVNLIANLYRKQKAKVRVAGVYSANFSVKKGVRQGCVISPYLFNIVAEMVMREALEGYERGVLIGGRCITNLRYADDIILLASSEKELQELVDRVNRAGRRYGLKINENKTKVMATSGGLCTVRINNNILDQVDTFPYLGSLITDDANCTKEIRARLAKGYNVCLGLYKIWQNHGIHMSTKLRLLKTLVWPVATYGCESWTIKKADENRINAFEMKCLRRVLRITWTEKRTNEWVLEKAGVDRTLMANIKERKMGYYGHIIRKPAGSFEKDLIQGTTSGGRGRGRPSTTWMDNIRTWTGMTLEQITRSAEDRREWKRIIHDAANPQHEDG